MFKAAIFDMDGVLVDSELIQSMAFEKVLQEYGVTPVKNEHGTVHISGLTTPETWEVLKERHGFEADTQELTEKKRAAAMEAMRGDIAPLPGVVALLEDLSEHGIALAVGTSAQRERAEFVLGKLGLTKYFAALATANDIERGKPAPDVYLEAAKRLGVEPADCVVFEDAVMGVQAGKAAGMKVVAVPNEYTKRMDFSLADTVVPTLAGINFETIKGLYE